MAAKEPMTQALDIEDVEEQLGRLVAAVSRNGVRVIVEESGTAVAALVSVKDFERWSRLDREREARFAVLDRMREAFADVPPEEIEREVAKAVAEVRREMAAERAAQHAAGQ